MSIFFKKTNLDGSVELELNKESKSIIQHLIGYTPSKLFRESIDETFKKMKETGYVTLISNTFDHDAIPNKDKGYARNQMIKYCNDNNIEVKMIFVIPLSKQSKRSTEIFSTNIVKHGRLEPISVPTLFEAIKLAKTLI